MSKVAEKTDPELWEKVKRQVKAGDKGGKPGQWSARKAQEAVQDYKNAGGGYKGPKTQDNHLVEWQHEEWGTKSGSKSLESGERYLPKKAREALSSEDYSRTTAKKRADLKAGRQFSRQPRAVAEKTARYRVTGGEGDAASSATKAELMRRARERDIPGRSRMSKDELERALRR